MTGAAGFIGRHVLPLLISSSWEVHAVAHHEPESLCEKCQWHRANLLDDTEARRLLHSIGASHLLHLAWYTKPGRFWNARENFDWVSSSLRLIDTFANSGGQRVVVAGTCAEYDWSHGYCREGSTPLIPGTVYGTCKNALRQLLQALADISGLKVSWGRVFHLYGPHEAEGRLVSSVIRCLLQDSEAHCTYGKQLRDFLHVEDVASAFAKLLCSDESGAFNIASGEAVTLRKVAQRIGEEIGRPHLLRFGALPSPELEAPLIVGDNERLRKLGWAPAYSLETGIRQTVAWWRTRV